MPTGIGAGPIYTADLSEVIAPPPVLGVVGVVVIDDLFQMTTLVRTLVVGSAWNRGFDRATPRGTASRLHPWPPTSRNRSRWPRRLPARARHRYVHILTVVTLMPSFCFLNHEFFLNELVKHRLRAWRRGFRKRSAGSSLIFLKGLPQLVDFGEGDGIVVNNGHARSTMFAEAVVSEKQPAKQRKERNGQRHHGFVRGKMMDVDVVEKNEMRAVAAPHTTSTTICRIGMWVNYLPGSK